jgi:hypothetical protein
MKKTFLVILVYSFAHASMAQVNMRDSTRVSDYYFQKSVVQKRTGFNLLGFGAGFMVIGGILSLTTNDPLKESSIVGAIMVVGGGLAALASIPFFISSGNNLKKANSMSLGLKMIRTAPGGIYNSHLSYVPSVSIKIGLK